MSRSTSSISKITSQVSLLALSLSLLSCSDHARLEQAGMDMITAEHLREHIEVLSHDSLEGRQTGSRGEMAAGDYIASQLDAVGVRPGEADGDWFQEFELFQKTPAPPSRFVITGNRTLRPAFMRQYVASTVGNDEVVDIRGELVFTGYSIDAPEYDWDDFGDVDLTGKILVSLWSEPETDDPTFFEGQTQSEYAGVAYKARIAREKGAAGILYVYDPEKLPYPWPALAGFFAAPGMGLPLETTEGDNLRLQGMVTPEFADELFSLSGNDFNVEKDRAETAAFTPVGLEANLNTRLSNEVQTLSVRNVVGFIPGTAEDEFVLYTAHTDHLGIGAPDSQGDSIYNGAIDNASGCAALIEIGRAFTNLPSPPQRSIVLLAVSAEEKGLLGSQYYAENPIYPLEQTLAVINFDGVLPWGNPLDLAFFGHDRSTLGELLSDIAGERGMTVGEDPMPEQNFYMRSDHYSFAQHGVPGGMLLNGLSFEGQPAGWGLERLQRWLVETYHHPHEELTDDWDWRPVETVVKVGFQMGYRLTTAREWPEWYDGQPYKTIREAALGSVGVEH